MFDNDDIPFDEPEVMDYDFKGEGEPEPATAVTVAPTAIEEPKQEAKPTRRRKAGKDDEKPQPVVNGRQYAILDTNAGTYKFITEQEMVQEAPNVLINSDLWMVECRVIKPKISFEVAE
jgi:hypothetical protein